MVHQQPFSGRRHEASRLEGFSDAVFGFALTLLVVSLEVPRTFDELWTSMRGFVAFGICFTILFQVWWRHFNFFRRYGLQDPTTIALTGLLLFVVLFYVYPLKFMFSWLVDSLLFGFDQDILHPNGVHETIVSRTGSVRLMQIYSAGVVMVFGVFVWLYAHAYRQRDALGLTASEVLATRISLVDNAGFALIGLVSVVMATALPQPLVGLAGIIYFLIGPFKFWLGWYSAAQQRRIAEVRASTVESR
jgi:uncharacterized membrane protein